MANFQIERLLSVVLEMATRDGEVPTLDWQEDTETRRFVEFWFYENQRGDLARIAFALDELGKTNLSVGQDAALNALRVAFSRIIITKEQGASLARDTSHSRPHRVATASDYKVIPNFVRSAAQVRKRLLADPPVGRAQLRQGDARALCVPDATVDAVITSPPYLNAIDYMRGHRMSLVWLGHSIPALRGIRSNSIGAERSADAHDRAADVGAVMRAMRGDDPLGSRLEGVMERYALDLLGMTSEICRVLKPGRRATFVVGNSCIKGAFINNASGVVAAAQSAGLTITERRERDLPAASRYLPISGQSLSKRMRTETVLVGRKPD